MLFAAVTCHKRLHAQARSILRSAGLHSIEEFLNKDWPVIRVEDFLKNNKYLRFLCLAVFCVSWNI